MSDDPIRDTLDDRAERGQERGADQVWADAAEPSYVSPASPPRTRWMLVAGAAAAALLLVGGIVGALVLTSDSDDSAITLLGEGSPEGPGACILEVDSSSRLTLRQWVAVVLYLEGIRSAEAVDVQSGAFALANIGAPPVTFGAGTRGVYFESERVGDVAHLADEPGVVDLTCLLTPDWAWVPDDPPPGTELLFVFFDRETEVPSSAHREMLERDGVRAVQMVSQDEAWRDFQELFVDEPEIVDAVSPELLPESVRVLVDESSAAAIQAELEAMPGVYQVVRGTEETQ